MSSVLPGRWAGTFIVGIWSLMSLRFFSSRPPPVISDGKTPGAMQLTRTFAVVLCVNSKAIVSVRWLAAAFCRRQQMSAQQKNYAEGEGLD